MRTSYLLPFLFLLGCYSSDQLTGRIPSPEPDDTPSEDTDSPFGDDDDSTDESEEPNEDQDDDDDEGDDPPPEPDPEPVADNAEIIFWSFPSSLTCGESTFATLTARNTGTQDWTRTEGYKLGTVDDSDPFFGPGTRVWLGEGHVVPPQSTWTFEIDLVAPAEPGTFITDWQMVHEGITWFGETLEVLIDVECSEQTYVDPLTDDSIPYGFASKVVTGGNFGPLGWQSGGGSDQLMIALDIPIFGSGSLELDVTNFDPATQYSGPKHQVLNLYTSDNGSQDVFGTDEAWWNLRTGTNYGSGVKFLASPLGGGNREEARILDGTTWFPGDLHTWTVTWDSTDISILLDGSVLVTLPFAGRVQPMQYIFIGKDNVYAGQAGPIYSNLRVTY